MQKLLYPSQTYSISEIAVPVHGSSLIKPENLYLAKTGTMKVCSGLTFKHDLIFD
jgi:hypothetical protein